jgi:UPF0755 protein
MFFPYFKKNLIISVGAVCIGVFFIIIIFFSSPQAFPVGSVFTVSSGESLSQVAHDLHARDAIRSPVVFRLAVMILGGEKKVIAGDYLLDGKQTSLGLAYRFVKGNFRLDLVKLTIPEGWSTSQISEYVGSRIEGFDVQSFLSLAKEREGFLFPDTYFVSPHITPQRMLALMEDNFNKAIESIPEIAQFGKSLNDLITMASLIEAEAKTETDRKLVAGVLWKRLELNMPLQVDSVFQYINGKNTYQLTKNDLKINSPYNTYVHTGLPPTPINSPGLQSIKAALFPTMSEYLYFLSSRDGTFYYASTLAEHNENKRHL